MSEVDLDILGRVELFSGLKGKHLKRVAESMTERTFALGEEVTKEGEVSVGFYVIEQGSAKVTMHGDRSASSGRATSSARSR